jgi:hypothetical protein
MGILAEWCDSCRSLKLAEAADLLQALHRYTITGDNATFGYFRLVEDKQGAWVTWAEVENIREFILKGMP